MNADRHRMRIGVIGLITIGNSSAGTAGGVEKLVEEVATRLAGRGHEVTVYCRAKYNINRLKEWNGVKICSLPAVYTKHLESFSHSFLSTLVAMLTCDVIQFHSMGPALFALLPRLLGCKVVCTLHGLDWRRDKWGPLAKQVLKIGERCAISFPNRTTVVSRFLHHYYPETYGKSVSFIPNGVPPICPRPLDRLKRFGLEPGKYVLYLSRIVPEKGSHYLIPAFKQLDTDMKLVMAGDARHAEEYLQSVKNLAKDDPRIIFTGPLYGEEKEEAFSNAYCFCLPSDLEGLPIVLLEAMGSGRCCLTSDIAELLEVVDPPRAGFKDADSADAPSPHGATFRRGDIEDLRNQLKLLIESPGEVERLGNNARIHADRNYNWDSIADQYENLYLSLTRGSDAAKR